MKSTRRAKLTAAVTAASVLAVCATAAVSSAASAASRGTVSISVASLIPGSKPAAVTQFNNQVKQFEKANPGIKVKSVQYQWTAPTFTAKLAAGTLPTVFTVPFTDGRTLGNNGQLADLTKYVKALPYYKQYNPAVIAEGTSSKGKIIAVPTAAYAQALHYNRALFTQAGLDPNKPPTTWAEVAADAKIITQKTGKAGYVQMGKDSDVLTNLVQASNIDLSIYGLSAMPTASGDPKAGFLIFQRSFLRGGGLGGALKG